MKAAENKLGKKLFSNEKIGRKLLKQLRENDKLDDKPIKTDYGYFKKCH